ncbi:VVA0879 family protein [Streptomyces sp. NPDC002172]
MPKRNRKVRRAASRRKRESGNNLSYTEARAEVRVQVPPAGSVLDEDYWRTLGRRLSGTDDWRQWRVVCRACGYIQSPADFIALERDDVRPEFAFSDCIGRYWENYDAETEGAFPCNAITWGFIPLDHSKVNWKTGKQGLVFRFAAPGERIEDNRRKHEARTRRWAEEAAAAAEEEAAAELARLQEEDEAAERDVDEYAMRCTGCGRAEGREHRQTCVWRAPDGLGERHDLLSELVDPVHAENSVATVIERVMRMRDAVGEYERAIVAELSGLGLQIEEADHSSVLEVDRAEVRVWLPRTSEEAPRHRVVWTSYFGWCYSDGVLGTSLKYRGGEEYEPPAAVIAAEIGEIVESGGVNWTGGHEWRDTLAADDWAAVVAGLRAAAGVVDAVV